MRKDRPGYLARTRKDGTKAHYWVPQRAVRTAPSHFKPIRLGDELDDNQILEQCALLTAELKKELSVDENPGFDGTIKSLITLYRTDKSSTFHSVKYSSKKEYEWSLLKLEQNVGGRSIQQLRGSDFTRWFKLWKVEGHRSAHGAIKLLRIILSYGVTERLPGCREAREILSLLKFPPPPPRKVFMTYEQCLAIVRMSAKIGMPSIGFVEALKFETALRRIDVIGEYVRNNNMGPFLWTGLTADQISDDLILTVDTSKTDAPVAHDLKLMPLVMEALKAYQLPATGPVVLSEATGRPYLANRYAIKFAYVRDAAGVPPYIWSMDTRAGAITEAVDATGSLEVAQNLATHSSPKMTRRYARGLLLRQSRSTAKARNDIRE